LAGSIFLEKANPINIPITAINVIRASNLKFTITPPKISAVKPMEEFIKMINNEVPTASLKD
jgi:hypothetical protein